MCKAKKSKVRADDIKADDLEGNSSFCCLSKFTSHMVEIYETTCDFADNQFDLYKIQ